MELNIEVHPKARRDGVGVHGERVTVRVAVAPEKGKANDAVVALLRLEIAKGRVRVVRGHKARNKRLCIDGMTAEQVFVHLSGK